MKRILVLLAALLLLVAGCSTATIHNETWNYDIVLNNRVIGNTLVDLKQTGDRNISTTTTAMAIGNASLKSEQLIIETRDFKPVKYHLINTVNTGGRERSMVTAADIRGKRVTLKRGDITTRVEFKNPFILNGYYFYFELLNKGFDRNIIITKEMYEPSIEAEKLLHVQARLTGRKKVRIRGELKELYHIRLSIEDIKYSDIYMNKAGVTEMMRVTQLNNVIELILRK